MTIKDVAKMAGVSPSTVSRVINKGDSKSASPDTQKKIWEAVKKLGYTPNLHAQSLKTVQPNSSVSAKEIACVYGRTADSFINPFFSELMSAVEKAAYERGYFLRFSSSAIPAEHTEHPGSTNAVIILGRTDNTTLHNLQNVYRHVLYTGLQDLPMDIDQVISSGYQAARTAVQYLLSLGHRKICYIGEKTHEQRFLAYKETMAEAGLTITDQDIGSTDLSPGQGYEAVNQLFEKNQSFTAIFCSNDILAVGALKALKDHHFKVPDDVSLISIDDIETAGYLSPMLTTIHIPIQEMGAMAVKLLIDRIEGGHRIPMKVNLPNKIVYRDSCGQYKNR